MTLGFLPIFVICLNSKHLLVMIGMDSEVAQYAHTYNLSFLPALYFYGLIDAQRRFLTSIGHPTFTVIAQTIGAIMHIFWSWLFVVYYKYDLAGIGMASISTNLIIFVIVYVYMITLPEIREAY